MKKVADFVGRWCNWIVGSLYVAGAVAFAIIGPVHSQTNPGLRLQGSFVVGDCVLAANGVPYVAKEMQ